MACRALICSIGRIPALCDATVDRFRGVLRVSQERSRLVPGSY